MNTPTPTDINRPQSQSIDNYNAGCWAFLAKAKGVPRPTQKKCPTRKVNWSNHLYSKPRLKSGI